MAIMSHTVTCISASKHLQPQMLSKPKTKYCGTIEILSLQELSFKLYSEATSSDSSLDVI